ncbi:uncharacterized protein LOC110654821 [Hevea brasiliensis]|uniref:uncharacterized protein LOC110654821 n=1 Tax=Hevea brasiliensis TaxID=3981 RepID=UPI0025F2042C|nr:uncharacterized protein LOC110654821 [Hevea brasiliensis]
MQTLKGRSMWMKMNKAPFKPLEVKKSPKKPKKLGRKDKDEPKKVSKLSRKGAQMTCSRCNLSSHNTRSYKAPATESTTTSWKRKRIKEQSTGVTSQPQPSEENTQQGTCHEVPTEAMGTTETIVRERRRLLSERLGSSFCIEFGYLH